MADLNINLNQEETLTFNSFLGERSGNFVNTSDYQDVCEFLTTQSFTPVTVADELEIVSTNVNDTIAGTGSRTVGVIYLDADLVWSQTIVEMNGTTPVPLTGIVASHIISMSVLTGGSNPVSLGTIDLRKVGAPTTIYEQIFLGGNQSKSCRFTCPAGHYTLITDVVYSTANQSAEFTGRSLRNQFDGSSSDRYLFKDSILLTSGSNEELKVNHRLDAGQTYKVSVIPGNVNARVFVTVFCKIVKL